MGFPIKGQHEDPCDEVILYPACIHVNTLLVINVLQFVTCYYCGKLGKEYMDSSSCSITTI